MTAVPSTRLPPLPAKVGKEIEKLSQRALEAAVGFWQSFLVEHAPMYGSEVLPLTGFEVKTLTLEFTEEVASEVAQRQTHQVILRSSFDALSGWCDDDFQCIEELCRSARCDLGLSPSMFPAFSTLSPNLNSYLLDYYKHGQLGAIIKNNRIPRTEVYEHLDTFKFMLKSLAATAERRAAVEANRPTSFSDPVIVSAFSAVSKEFEGIMKQGVAAPKLPISKTKAVFT